MKMDWLFEKLLGKSLTLRVLEYLLIHEQFDFTLTQMTKAIGISRTAIRIALRKLLAVQVVEMSRKDTKSEYYRIKKMTVIYIILRDLYINLKKRTATNFINPIEDLKT